MPFDFSKYDLYNINKFDGKLFYPFVFDYKGINAAVGIRTVDVLLSGVSPLTLLNAIELHYIKAFGNAVYKYSDLPVGYTKLTYLESAGSQIVQTDVIPGEDDVIEVDYELTNLSAGGDKFIVGCPLPDGQPGMWVETYGSSNSWYVRYGSNTSASSSFQSATQSSGTFQVKKGSFSVNGVQIVTPSWASAVTRQMTIFARASSGTIRGAYIKISNVRVTRSGTLYRNYVPAKYMDGTLGLYETIEGTFLTNQGTGSFTAGAEVNPTPTSPANIVCNNGTLTGYHESGLPLGYTKLSYLKSTGTQFIDTGVVSSNLIEVDIKFRPDGWEGAVFGAYSATGYISSSTTLYISTSQSGYVYCTDYGHDEPDNTNRTKITNITLGEWYQVDIDWKNRKAYYDGNTINLTSDTIWTGETNEALFARSTRQTIGGYIGNVAIEYCKIYDNGVIVRDYIPAMNANGVLGMYDLINGVFYTNNGTGTFVAGDIVNDPISVSGTTETVSIDTTGDEATCEPLLKIASDKDIQNITTGEVTRKVGTILLDGSEDWSLVTEGGYNIFKATLLDNNAFSHLMCTHFRNYAPTQNNTIYSASESPVVQIRYDTASTVADLKQFLATELANYRPVIVVYGLETPVSVSVQEQELTIEQGTNVITATGALPILELEVFYKSAVVVTVEEIEAVNTDSNVTVTIS